MTDPLEIVMSYYRALATESVDKAARFLAPKLVVKGSSGELFDRGAYLL